MTDQSCLNALLNLYPYLDGELSAADAEVVRRHFDLCGPCAPALPYLRSFRDAVHRAAEHQPSAPAVLRQKLEDLLRGTA